MKGKVELLDKYYQLLMWLLWYRIYL